MIRNVDARQVRLKQQRSYRLSQHKLQRLSKDYKYMLDHKIIEPSQTELSLPINRVLKLFLLLKTLYSLQKRALSSPK